MNLDLCPNLEKVVLDGDRESEDIYIKDIFESVIDNGEFVNYRSGHFSLNVSKVAFDPRDVPKRFGVENINALSVDLSSRLLGCEEFDLVELFDGLSKNLEILEYYIDLQDWNNPAQLPLGT